MTPSTRLPGQGSGLVEETIPFIAGDGKQLNLIHVRGAVPPAKGPVIVVHGAGVRANIFRAPSGRDIVEVLTEQGYDVWLENWRASIDFPPMEWTLDQAALYDHPRAVATICDLTGADRVAAIIHCQGSTSFMMSAVAGLVPNVDRIVSNAVSLHPAVPWFSNFKLQRVIPLVRHLTRYANPHWGESARTTFAKVTAAAVRATHHECDNSVCKMVSFVYGSGRPALWRHENINAETHEWIINEFGNAPMSFFSQMARCVAAGHLVAVDALADLPADFTATAPQTDARITLLAGALNRCFLPSSQERTLAYLEDWQPGRHRLHVFPAFSHLDVFMGKDAANITFPWILQGLGE